MGVGIANRRLRRRIKTSSTSASSSSLSADLIGSTHPSGATIRSWLGHGVLHHRWVLLASGPRSGDDGSATWTCSAGTGKSGRLRMDVSSLLNDE